MFMARHPEYTWERLRSEPDWLIEGIMYYEDQLARAKR